MIIVLKKSAKRFAALLRLRRAAIRLGIKQSYYISMKPATYASPLERGIIIAMVAAEIAVVELRMHTIIYIAENLSLPWLQTRYKFRQEWCNSVVKP